MQCVIVGAGAFGLAAACELASRGHGVVVCDASQPPHPLAASSDISKIVRIDYGADTLTTELAEQALAGWRSAEALGEQTLFHETGLFVLSSTPLAPGSFEGDSHATLSARGHRLERLDAAALAQKMPAFRAAPTADGYYNPQGGYVESGRVIAGLVAEARRRGVWVLPRVAVTALSEGPGGRVTGVVTARGERIPAALVVAAMGAWTPSWLARVAPGARALACRPVAQPVLHFRPAHPERFRAPRFAPFTCDIGTEGWYGFPATDDGIVKIANHGPGIALEADAGRGVPPEIEPRFRAFLRARLPELADAPLVESKLCLYCDSADGDFVIDVHPERPGLLVATGDSGHAFKFTPVLGKLVADIALGKDNPFAKRCAWRTGASTRKEAARATSGAPVPSA